MHLAPLPSSAPRFRLAFAPGQVSGCVRQGLEFTRTVLARHWLTAAPAVMGDALLVVAELLANAVEHAHGPTDLVLAFTLDAGLRIEVTDTSPALPALRHSVPGQPHGRGLRIVDRTATTWGATATASGKTVWAHLAPYPASPDNSGQDRRLMPGGHS